MGYEGKRSMGAGCWISGLSALRGGLCFSDVRKKKMLFIHHNPNNFLRKGMLITGEVSVYLKPNKVIIFTMRDSHTWKIGLTSRWEHVRWRKLSPNRIALCRKRGKLEERQALHWGGDGKALGLCANNSQKKPLTAHLASGV